MQEKSSIIHHSWYDLQLVYLLQIYVKWSDDCVGIIVDISNLLDNVKQNTTISQ